MASSTGSSGPPLRVMHVLRGAQGGSLRHVRDLVDGQERLGHQVGIVSTTGMGGSETDDVFAALSEQCALDVHRLPMARSLGLSDISAIGTVRRICRRVRPQIIHGHGAKGAAYARMLARAVGARAVYTPHGGSLHYSWSSPSGALYLSLERLLKRRTDGMIFESEYARRTYEQKLGEAYFPYRVIHNGLRESEFVPTPRGSERFDFVFVGEIRRLKGLDVLLEAAVELRRDHESSLLIVGAGPDEEYLRGRIATLDLTDSIRMVQPIHPARDAFAMARCVVVPSLAESLPYIVLEVLAARVPILATKVGGIPEIFGRHSNVLLPPGDPHALAQAMTEVLVDPEGALGQATVLHERVKRHLRVRQMVDGVVEFYRAVLLE